MSPEFEDKAQPELFDNYKKAPFKRLRFKAQALFSRPKPNITISYENFIFLLIGFILFGIVSFSLGFEKGKYIGRKEKEMHKTDVRSPVNVTQIERAEKITPYNIKPYTIQVATFKKLEAAEREASQLRSFGYEASVLRSGDYFRVCVGDFAKRQEADRVLTDLKKKFADCFVTK